MAFRPKPDMKPGHKVALFVPAVRQPMLPLILCKACAPILCIPALPRALFYPDSHSPNTSIAGSSRRRRPQPKACIGALPVFALPLGNALDPATPLFLGTHPIGRG